MKILLLFIFFGFILITFITRAVNKWSYHENKYTIYKKIIDPYKLNSYEYDDKIVNNSIKYPFIIKPIICSGTNKGVQIIKNHNELIKFNKNKYKNEKYMVQEFYPSKYEVGLLYEKIPHITNGKIVSIILKINKNSNNWKPLQCDSILVDRGTQCSNKMDLITEELTKSIQKIASKIPGFYMGRFDIGFNNIDDFKKGKNFKCFELNGVMGYDLRITNNKKFEIEEFKLALRWILVRLLTGSINLLTGNALYYDIIKSYYPSLINFRKCKDYEKLFESCTA
jgi:hypothetical protein